VVDENFPIVAKLNIKQISNRRVTHKLKKRENPKFA